MPLPGGIAGHMGVMGQGGPSDKTSAWPTGWWHVMLTCSSTTLDPLDAYTGVGSWGIRGSTREVGILGVTYENEDGLLQSILENSRSLLQTIEHELRSMGPMLVPLLATRCLNLGHWGAYGGWGSIWQTSAWSTGWWHVTLICSSTILDH